MNLSSIFFSMIVFVIVLMGIGSFYNDMAGQYAINGSSNLTYNTSTKYIPKITTLTGTVYADINSTDTGLPSIIWNFGVAIFKAPIDMAMLFLNVGSIFTNEINTLGQVVNFPSWFAPILFTTITMIIMIAIIRLVWIKEV
jgi:hypothetical protein